MKQARRDRQQLAFLRRHHGETFHVRLKRLELENIGIGDAAQIPFRRVKLIRAGKGVDGRGKAVAQPKGIALEGISDGPRAQVQQPVDGIFRRFEFIGILESSKGPSLKNGFDAAQVQLQHGIGNPFRLGPVARDPEISDRMEHPVLKIRRAGLHRELEEKAVRGFGAIAQLEIEKLDPVGRANLRKHGTA